jgi:preprotein translocase subunit SecG
MQSVLIVVHLMIVVALVVTVLLQRSEGGALGVGGGGFMTGRGQANVLTRTTAILGALFFATSLGLTILAKFNQAPEVLLQSVKPIEPSGQAPAQQNGGSGNLLDQLKQLEEERQQAPAPIQPSAPPAPSGK